MPKKSQPEEVTNLYSVIIDGQPRSVEAASIEDAIRLAQQQSKGVSDSPEESN